MDTQIQPETHMNQETLQQHINALRTSGYTLVPHVLSSERLDALRGVAQAVSEDYIAFWRAGGDLTQVNINPRPTFDETPNGRCAYLWSDEIFSLLDLDLIHQIAQVTMPEYLLNDVVTNIVQNSPDDWQFAFHRDYATAEHPEGKHMMLWFFFLLDDFTLENGATWVVPGSHRIDPVTGEFHPVRKGKSETLHYPSAVQLTAKAGDLAIVDPTVIHSPGRNTTPFPRRTINVRLSVRDRLNIADHWSLLNPEQRSHVSERVARMMRTGREDLRTTWALQPNMAVRS